ncbi:CDP-diacylglycerol---serine O-phosphatidyltransferase [Methanofervidicoccus abyssi]|uniref:CDP-diacylglycerol--serine O-phosphatidyltransferase n=1 Tax=Methanofervidicoccus abyssi TaxID=2082189 RepID=A0A401HQL4_9EURY|nr:CDP-diacylglycerol---serine O-phosphatidyltransferase [Methanofervidicoccus abyssi]
MGRKFKIFRIRGMITVSDYLTMINIVLGMLAVFFQDFRFIYLALVFDALDGYVARKTNTVTDFGAQLDSLCDVVSFGVAPSYLLYHYFGSTWSLVTSLIFLLCGALRLARFNTLDVKDFVGLPIPAGALLLSTFSEMILKYDKMLRHYYWDIDIFIFGTLIGFLMISDIIYPKYPRRWYLVIFGISLVLSLFNIPEGLFICAIGYALYGVFHQVKSHL